MGFSSKHTLSNDKTPHFQPCQIVCLEHESSCLYAEVIQIIESRQICWVRPLALAIGLTDALASSGNASEPTEYYDLRQDSDLLWPLSLFRAALDLEALPLLSRLYASDRELTDVNNNSAGYQPFRQFVHQVWQAHSDRFQAAD